jgi:plasmid maintenance system antidote protein VapI
MAETSTFEPDWLSPPGETIRQLLHDRQLDESDIVPRLELSPFDFDALISGALEISPLLALRLEGALGLSAQFWERREQQYRDDQRRLVDRVRVPTARDWLRDLPVQDMIKFGWIRRGGSLAEFGASASGTPLISLHSWLPHSERQQRIHRARRRLPLGLGKPNLQPQAFLVLYGALSAFARCFPSCDP